MVELFLKCRLQNGFSLLKLHMAKDMEEKQQKQKWQYDRSGVKLCELVKEDTVHVRNHRGGQEKWIPGKIIRRLELLTYFVQVRVQRHYVHVDHLRLTAESDSYWSVSENTMPMIPNVPSPMSDESVCQPVSVLLNT